MDIQNLTDNERAVLKKWNWGAATLQWIWGIGHGVYLMSFIAFLLSLIPIVGAILPFFVFGSHGNQWAWENGHWQDIQHFDRVQRLWAHWGFGISALVIVCAVIFLKAYWHSLLGDYLLINSITS
jgi:hypothetical protein